MVQFIRKTFTLPTVQERHAGSLLQRVFFPGIQLQQDDTYIYYLVFRNSFVVSSLFAILYVIAFVAGNSIDLGLFTLSIDPADKAMSVGYAFGKYVGPLVLALFAPYAWLLFHFNIDLRSFDLLKRMPAFAQRMQGDRGKTIRTALFFFCGGAVVVLWPFGVPGWIIDHRLATRDSPVLFIISLGLYAAAIPSGMLFLVIGASVAYQHLRSFGPYYMKEK